MEREIKTVADLGFNEDYHFIVDSQDVKEIKKAFCKAKQFDSFFVKIDSGDYKEVYGMHNTVPWQRSELTKIK